MMKPTLEEAAVYYQELGKYLADRGKQDTARLAYLFSIQSWDEASMEDPSLIDRYQAAEFEYSQFARTDPVYLKILRLMKYFAQRYPGISQSDLFTIMDKYSRDDLSYALYFAQKHGELYQTNEGQIYELRVPPA
jgi:hypothetical protein